MGSIIVSFVKMLARWHHWKAQGRREREKEGPTSERGTQELHRPKVEETREEDDSDTSGTPNISCKWMDFISLCITSFTFHNKIILQSNEFQKKSE